MNINELDSYDLKDAIRFHSRLNPRLWDGRERIKPEVREALLKIADDFREFLGVPDLQVRDITISGSNASYTYTPHSDIDLHLVVDIPELYDPVYRELFNAKKYQYNDQHDITVRDADVELYVQPSDEAVVSQGEYSLKNDQWLQVPRRQRASINDGTVRNKYEDLKQRIENSAATGEGAEALMKKIRAMRQAGLDEHGEFSAENLAFKMLRSQGYIEKLANARSAAHARELSLDEEERLKKKPPRRSYGFSGGYWFPGFAYAGQDHPAGTESSEPVEEGFADNLYKAAQAGVLAGAVATGSAAEPPAQEPVTIAYVTINGETKKFDLGNRFDSSKQAEKFVSDVLDRQGLEGTYSIEIKRGYPKQQAKEDVGHTWDGVSPSTTMFASEDVGHTWDGVSPSTTMFASEDESSDRVDTIRRFAHQCARHLGLTQLPKIKIIRGTRWSEKNHSFGRYVPEEQCLYLAIDNRHIMDVLRTLAHELTHARQDQDNRLDINSGETGSPEENEANARAGEMMRDFAETNPDQFQSNIQEASGYIPSEAEKDDPRFEMALSVDIHPDSMQDNAKKLGWKIARDGTPPLLRESQDLFEVAMTPKALQAWARSPEAEGIQAGFEAELCFADFANNDGEADELEPDYDQDTRPESIDDVIDFFSYDDWGYGISLRRQDTLRNELQNEYTEWIDNQLSDENLREEFDTWMWDVYWSLEKKDLILDKLEDQDLDEQEIEAALQAARDEFQEQIDLEYEQRNDGKWDEFIDEYRDDFMQNHDERQFLRSEYGYMSDISNTYELNWPYMIQMDGGGTKDPDELRPSLARAVNMRVKMGRSWHSVSREPDTWIIEGDSSIQPDNREDVGFEIVSPVQSLPKTLSDLDKVMDWARHEEDGYTNSTTGLHMNISLPNRGADVDYVKLLLFMGDQHILKKFGRESVHFCSSSFEKLNRYIASAKKAGLKKLPDAFTLMRSNLIELASRQLTKDPGKEKYQSAHVHVGDDTGKPAYIEFRGPGGDYLDKTNQELNTTFLRLARAMQIAGDPSAERREYAKKLYKLLAPEGNNAMLNLFASYSAGSMTPDQLKNAWAEQVLQIQDPNDVENKEYELFDERKPEEILGVVTGTSYDIPNYVTSNFPAQDWLWIDWREAKGEKPDLKTRRSELAKKIKGVKDTQPALPQGAGEEYLARLKDPQYPSIYQVRFRTPDVGTDFAQAAAALWRHLRNQGYSQEQIDQWTIQTIENSQGLVMSPQGVVGGETSSDANYEIVSRNTNQSVFRFIANTDQEAQRKYSDWLAGNNLPDTTENYGWRRIGPGIPGSTVDRAQQRARSQEQEFTGYWEVVSRPTDEVVYTFGGVGNAVADAEARAQIWARNTGFDDPIYVRPLMRPRGEPAQGTESLPPGNTRWLVLDANDREVYSFVHRSNQGEANQYARDWLQRQGYLGSGEFTVVPAR